MVGVIKFLLWKLLGSPPFVSVLPQRFEIASRQTVRLRDSLTASSHHHPAPEKDNKKMVNPETKADNEYERQRLENIEKNRKLLKYVPPKSSPLTAKGSRSLQCQHRSQTRETSNVY